MKSTSFLFALAIVAVCGSIGFAQDLPPEVPDSEVQQDTDVISDASAVRGGETPEDTIENMMDHWLDGEIWQNGKWVPDPNPANGKTISATIEKKGGSVVQGLAPISSTPENPEWGKFRVTAYEKALNIARTQYLLELKQTIQAETFSDLAQNDQEIPPYKPNMPKSMEEELYRKTLAVAGSKLDTLLEDAGVDKKEFEQAPESQKHTLMKEAVGRRAMIKSFGKLSGLMPVQTFDGFSYDAMTKKKVRHIGVICTVTPASRQFAVDVLKGRGDLPPSEKKGQEMKPYYRSISDSLIDMFGVRRMKDENGYPVLVAFGQWSNSKKTSNPTLRMRYSQIAQKQADTWARTELSLFLDSNFVYERPSEMGEVFEEAVAVHPDGFNEEANTTKILDTITENLRGKSKVVISGAKVLYSWKRQHPEYPEIELVGVVLGWSPVWEKNARNLMKDLVPTSASSQEGKARDGVDAQSGESRKSEMDMDLDDF